MENTASFQFENFLITKSLFELGNNSEVSDLSIGFRPSGKLDMENQMFHLELGVFISDSSEAFKVEVEALGFFKFENIEKEDLSSFLYHNAPALLFPYIRAYISSLTTLSGIKPIVLPTLNLSNLKDDLEQNILETSLKKSV